MKITSFSLSLALFAVCAISFSCNSLSGAANRADLKPSYVVPYVARQGSSASDEGFSLISSHMIFSTVTSWAIGGTFSDGGNAMKSENSFSGVSFFDTGKTILLPDQSKVHLYETRFAAAPSFLGGKDKVVASLTYSEVTANDWEDLNQVLLQKAIAQSGKEAGTIRLLGIQVDESAGAIIGTYLFE